MILCFVTTCLITPSGWLSPRSTWRGGSRHVTEPLHADFSGGASTVLVPTETVRVWASGDEVGLYAQDGELRIAIEKDFRCLTRAGEEPDAYTHPAE